jgi:hypothetical protein
MLKIKVTEKSGAWLEYQSEQMIDPSALGHGKAERLVPESEEHDPADVLETVQVEVKPAIPAVLDGEGNMLEPEVPAVVVPHVRLKAEYTVEVQDVTAQLEQERINREALEYLASTDWMAVRASEGAKPMPEEVKQARAEARARIVR